MRWYSLKYNNVEITAGKMFRSLFWISTEKILRILQNLLYKLVKAGNLYKSNVVT